MNPSKPLKQKPQIHLKSTNILDIRFIYYGHKIAAQTDAPNLSVGRLPHADDEMRIYMKTGNFFFKSMPRVDTVTFDNKQ